MAEPVDAPSSTHSSAQPATPVAAPLTVHLARGRDKSVRGGHPWIFSGAVARAEGPKGDSEPPLARVVAADGSALGIGWWSPRSQIRVRLLAAGGEAGPIDRSFFAARLHSAQRLRRAVVPTASTGYRVLNAEGDGVPGWTVDRFGDVLVSQVTVAGLEALRGDAYAALGEAFPGASVVQANAVPARRAEGLAQADEVVAGTPPPDAPFTEADHRGEPLSLVAEIAGGQKTGFYLDQSDNRRLAGRLASRLAGSSSDAPAVLDLFAHSGAFALHAVAAGAARAVCVESSERMIERGRRQLAANGIGDDRCEWRRADVFADLREHRERYDLVIADPPPLARRRGDRDRAARAYKDLNRLAFGRVGDGGFLLTFSCSGAIDGKLFRQILWSAAGEAGKRVRLLAPLAAAPDHPVAITHPEGEYLKGWLCQIEAS